jgi:uncharacterized membrane protein
VVAFAQSPPAALTVLIGVYVVVFGRMTWAQQSNFGTFGFDMGVFDQEIWLASRFHHTFITVRGLDMWANHVNPSIYLLVPFYWLGAGPHFLYLLQTVALALGAVPLWLLARDRWGDGWLALGIAVAWLLYPAVEWMTWWHFHPESLAVTPLLFAWWFATRRYWWPYAACVVLVLAAKEDMAFAVLALGLAVAVYHHRRYGLITAGAALAWLLVCLKVIMPHYTGAGSPFYADQYSALGNNLNQIAYNAVRHPSRWLRTVFDKSRHQYYEEMLAPVAFLAVLAPGVLFIAVPTALVNIVNNQGYPHDIKFQYQALVCAGVFLAVVEGIARARRPGLRRFMVGALCACALATNAAWSPSRLNNHVYHSGIWALHSSVHLRTMDEAVHMVPGGAAVSASYTAVPHLTHRTAIYEWPNPWVRAYYGLTERQPLPDPATVDYILLDTGLNENEAPLAARLTAPGGEFAVIINDDGVLLAHRVRPPATGVAP